MGLNDDFFITDRPPQIATAHRDCHFRALDYLLLDSLPQIEFGAGTERIFGAFQLASFGKVPKARPVKAQNSILGF